MKALILILVLAAVGLGQITTHYDKFKDITLLTTERVPLEPAKYAILFPDVGIDVTCGFDGQTPKTHINFILSIRSQSDEWRFLNRKGMVIIADTSHIDLGEGERSSNISSGGRSVSVTERLYWDMTQKDLSTIVNAKLVELQAGSFETTLPDYAKKQFKELLTACTP